MAVSLRRKDTLDVYKWNGSKWAESSNLHPQTASSGFVRTDSASDVWLSAWSVSGKASGWADHWNGSKWATVTSPAPLAASNLATPDGHGGEWSGPWAHWTGGKWVNTSELASPITGGIVDAVASIPGTSGSYWGVGGLTKSPDGNNHEAVVLYGPTP